MDKLRTWLTLGLLATALLAADDAPREVVETTDSGATINWTTGIITATGMGPKQERVPAGRQRVAQRRVAIADAYRMLAETVEGVHVTSETTVKNFELVDDSIHLQVDAVLKGQEIVKEWVDDEGVYNLTAMVRLRGAQASITQVVLPAVPKLEEAAVDNAAKPVAEGGTKPEPPAGQPAPPPEPKLDVPTTPPPPPTPVPARQPGPYTGLIVDCRGFSVERAMAPKIVLADESEVWGTVNVTREFVLDHGIVSYIPSLEMALDPDISRAGKQPLVVRAIGRQGSFKANAVISNDDGKLILSENDKTHFLDEFKVVFVVG